jgi:transposase
VILYDCGWRMARRMDIHDDVSTTPRKAKTSKQLSGSVLDVLRELLTGRRDDEIIELFAKLVARNKELELLLGKMRESKNRGEQISSAQLDLFLDKLREESDGELDEADAKLEKVATLNAGRVEPTKPPKQPPVRRPPPPGLRRVRNPISVPQEDLPCPICGTLRECIGHETTEVIDLIPAEVIVRLDEREIVACGKCDGVLERAPIGDKVVVGGAYGSRLVGDLVVGKYWDGLPLNRQGEQLLRLGLSMPSSSMADQITWATDLLRPLWHAQMAQVLGSLILHVDGTSLPVKDNSSVKGIVTGALWGYVGDTDKAVYLYTSTGKKVGQREGEIGPEQFLSLRKGFIVADASNLFDVTFRSPDRIEVGCNMHARRYCVKALDAGDVRASVAIAAFKTLYDVEDTARDMDAEGRLRERQQRSKPVYDELIAWCRTHQPTEPPGSLLGKALQYILNHRVALMRFLDDGRVPIDNGIVERLHRRPAVGRRSYLFAGSHAAAERAAIAYSILASCALVEVNPVEYLADILPKLTRGAFKAHEFAAMLPAPWKAARQNASAETGASQ